MEHLHMYCTSPILIKAREYCHKKIEGALYDLYNFASIHEYELTLEAAPRKTTLQEKLENVAISVEKQERLVVRNSHTKMETRETNVAILRKQALMEAVMLNKLPATKLIDYRNFPLASRLGILHCIPEESFDMATATITDAGFMGLFPKSFMQILATYTQEPKQSIPQTIHSSQPLFTVILLCNK
jgi:hypothetical protein